MTSDPAQNRKLKPQWLQPHFIHRTNCEADLFEASPTGLHILFGPNNAGKTNLLRRLSIAVFAAEMAPDDLRNVSPEIQRFPGTRERERWQALRAVRFTWARGALKAQIPADLNGDVETHLLSDTRGQFANFQTIVNKHLDAEPGRQASFIGTHRFLPSSVPVASEHYTLSGEAANPITPEAVTSAIVDLAQGLKAEDRSCFERIRTQFESVTGLSVGVYRRGFQGFLQVIEDGVDRPLDQCGDGLRDLLGLLFHVESQPDRDLFIDDPGTRLHPGAQRRVLRILEEASATRAIWIATHDAVFVSAPSASSRYAVARKNSLTTIIRVTKPDDARVASKDLGWLPGDAFVADTLLCCEGPSDKIVFSARLRAKRSASYAGVVVIDLGGVGKVWGKERSDLLRFAEVARAAVAHGRVVALIDGDEHVVREKNALKEQLTRLHIGVAFLSRPELEEYWLLSAELAHAILVGLAADAAVVSGRPVVSPRLEEVRKAIDQRNGIRASAVFDDLCHKHSIRWSKESAARIAIAKIDLVAPSVNKAIDDDINTALAAALPRESD